MRSTQWLPAVLATAAVLAVLPVPSAAQTTAETTTRSTEFDYHPVHGQVTLERIDPRLPTCVEKATRYDDQGNKTQLIVRPCAHITPDQPEWFAPRITVNEFSARTTDEPGTPAGTTRHAAGSYLTRTQTGALNAAGTGLDPAQARSEEQAMHDIRHGTPVRQTSVALADAGKSLSARTEYDGFGRIRRQTSALGTYVVVEYKRCKQADGPPDPACLNISKTLDGIDMPSRRLVDAQGQVTKQATARAVSAYYVQSTPYGADSRQMGAISRVHHDALHREIAQESQAYDGRWSRTLTAYDQLGQAAIRWGPHHASSNTSPRRTNWPNGPPRATCCTAPPYRASTCAARWKAAPESSASRSATTAWNPAPPARLPAAACAPPGASRTAPARPPRASMPTAPR
jgi:hypothetical protein